MSSTDIWKEYRYNYTNGNIAAYYEYIEARNGYLIII
jgi:hypothetical protein